ncbi:MAG TPA: hypothetical protein VLC93_16635, partial [Myxococcota bacterium]|nr:hypothetical protein [Myxococcota bacterium]
MALYLPPLDQGTEGLDAQRLLAEARLENRENQAAIAEDLSVKIACAAAEAEAAQEKARAQAEAARQANAALILLPEGEEDPSSDPSLTRDQPGPCQSDLLAQLDGVTIPDALELRVNNMLNAMASIDELIAQGLPDQAERMRSELEPLIAQLLSDLGVSPVTIDAPIFLPANPHFDSTFQTEPPGGWFYGVGDSGRTGQDSIYEWLSALVTARGQASTHGHYLLAASDEVTSLQQHLHDNAQYAFETTYLSRDEAIAALTEQGKTAAQIAEYLDTHERFMLAPGGNNGGDDGGTYGPTYGTRADYIRAIGLPEDAPLDLQISFNNSGSGSGDAWLDHSHADTDVTTRGGPERAYVALVDDHLAGEWVQIGDIGPLGDDIGKMLEDIFEDCGATTPEQQEAVRDMLFRYDERFGILANREFIAAAVETNNARRQGFFEGPVGRAIISIVAGVVGGPVVAAAVSAAITLADGGTFLDALRAGVAAYLGGVVGAEFGAWVTQTFQGALTPALTSALAGAANNFGASVVRQLITDGRLNGDALLISALGGAAGGFITNFTASSDLGQSLRDLFGDQRGARILGNLGAALVANGGRLSPADLVAALGVAATPSGGDPWIHTEDGTDIMVIEGQDGSTILMRRGDEIITMNPDGTFTLTNRDGTFPYDPTGNLDRLPGPTTGTTPAAEVSPFTPAEVATHLETFAQMNVSADDAQIFLALGLTPAEV